MAKRQARHPAAHAAAACMAGACRGTIAMFAAIVNIAACALDVLHRRRRDARCRAVHVRGACCGRVARRRLAHDQRCRFCAVHRLHLRRADAARRRDRLAGTAHRRGGGAAAPLRHRPGRRRRLPRAEHHLRPRPRRQRQSRDARRLDGGRRGRHRRRRGPLAARSRQGAGRARRQGPAAPRLRRSLQCDARLPARLLHLCHRPRCARPRLQDGRANSPAPSRCRCSPTTPTPSPRCR